MSSSRQSYGPRYTDIIAPLPSTVPFVGPETQERLRAKRFQARMGANENVFGPSPLAIEAMKKASTECWMYGDPENHELKVALSQRLGVQPENIVIGEGIDSLFGYTVRLMVAPGDSVVTSQGAYPTFNFHVTGFGGRLITVPYVNDKEDPESLLEAARLANPKLIYFANPDNPMGSWWSASATQSLIDNLPRGTVLVLDEAYSEFAPEGTLPVLDVNNPQVIRFRTFSKAWGMAGARIGYAIAEASVARSFDKIRNHFSVNRIAQAGALASLQDTDHLTQTVAKVKLSLTKISAVATQNGLRPLPSATNFVTIDCLRDGGFAKRVLDELIARDIFVRMPGVTPLNRAIRISAGTERDVTYFEAMLPQALRDASSIG
jgi:histidinol-phosphate aminotransferase